MISFSGMQTYQYKKDTNFLEGQQSCFEKVDLIIIIFIIIVIFLFY